MNNSSYIEWCNDNEGRAYPISEDASCRMFTGMRLPHDILADACVIVPPEHQDVFCASVRITPELISVAFSSSTGGLLAGTYRRGDYTPYSAVPLTPLTNDVSGWVVFGNHQATHAEHYYFDTPAQSRLSSRAVRLVSPLPVRKFLKLGGAPANYIQGLTKIAGGLGLRVYQEGDTTVVFELDPRRASLYLGPCEQYGDAGMHGFTPITRIMGVSADEDGTVTIRMVPHDWSET